ncbi:MAG: hypothetical protein HFJ58_01090 [Clostridia bacterium]|nr:hypothetical protein [Clostridia bacterium]
MTKKEFLDVLIPELRRLHEVEHLRDLVKNGRYDEAQAVLEEVEYLLLDEYCYDYRDGKQYCRLAVSDIPKEYLVTFTLYLSGSEDYNEQDIMECCKELQEAVAEQGEDGAIIARVMDNYVLNNFRTISELMEAA